jgi:4-amino-4-deoxy-L-arabinose transferase-like glycosyltransferase
VLPCVLACVGLFIASGLRVAARSSATSDEVPHIGAGVSYLRGDLRMNMEHPPLAKVLAALALPERRPPLRLSSADVPIETQWGFGSAWLHRANQRPLTLLLRARAPLVVLNALIVPAVAVLAFWLSGPLAACVSALLAATSPLWLAHATLVTTDAAASLFCFISTALTAALLVTSRKRLPWIACALALSLALALSTKYSMLAVGPFLVLGGGIGAHRADRRSRALWILGAAVLGTTLGVLLAWGWPPRPEHYVKGVLRVGSNHRSDYDFYEFGRFFTGHDPLYFARALLVKVTLPVWALCVIALVVKLRELRLDPPLTAAEHLERAALWPLFVVPVAYYALAALAAPAFGVRYVLPVVPFMFVAAGVGAARMLPLRVGIAAPALALLLLAQAASYVSAYNATPLGFFNGLFCFTGDALPCLDDSNLDWGQALPQLAAYRASHYPGVPLRVLYSGSSPVEAYVPNAVAGDLDEMTRPRAALYAVSLHYRVRSPESDWTRRVKPNAIVAGVYAIFDLRSLAQR